MCPCVRRSFGHAEAKNLDTFYKILCGAWEEPDAGEPATDDEEDAPPAVDDAYQLPLPPSAEPAAELVAQPKVVKQVSSEDKDKEKMRALLLARREALQILGCTRVLDNMQHV